MAGIEVKGKDKLQGILDNQWELRLHLQTQRLGQVKFSSSDLVSCALESYLKNAELSADTRAFLFDGQ